MKAVHATIFSPSRCGLYETTRELIAVERDLGIDARMVDPAPVMADGKPVFPHNGEDRGVPIVDMEWALTADVIVNHSGVDRTPLQDCPIPVVHVAHGRPLSTWMGERGGAAPGLTWQTQKRNDPRYKAAVTFWPEYEPYMRSIWFPKPIHVVPPPCNLEYWTPGESSHQFGGRRGSYNVVMTDPWSREDSSPYPCIHSFVIFNRYFPDARLHLIAWDGNKKGLTGLTNLLGKGGGAIMRWSKDVRSIMRAADMLISPHRIYTRSIREAMACGLQVVSGKDCHPEDIEQFALKMVAKRENPEPTRKMAEALFDPRRTGEQFKGILEGVV